MFSRERKNIVKENCHNFDNLNREIRLNNSTPNFKNKKANYNLRANIINTKDFEKYINPDNLEYLKYNERMLNEFYIPSLDYKYYVLQIADEDVNVIAPFHEQITPLVQNERFSLIRCV
jgi:hypothetical protein